MILGLDAEILLLRSIVKFFWTTFKPRKSKSILWWTRINSSISVSTLTVVLFDSPLLNANGRAALPEISKPAVGVDPQKSRVLLSKPYVAVHIMLGITVVPLETLPAISMRLSILQPDRDLISQYLNSPLSGSPKK